MKYSAGLIPFRINKYNEMEFFVGHPGGRRWKNIDYWAFLKGGTEDNEQWIDTAIREFKEETGLSMDNCKSCYLIPLGSVLQNPKKTAIAYGIYYPNINPDECHSNFIDDGVTPEIDKYRWMTYKELEGRTHETHLIFYQKLLKRNEDYNK